MKKYFSNKVTNPNASRDAPNHSYGKSGVRSGSQLACLCANRKTYSKECCNGDLQNQGIGKTTGVDNVTITENNGVRVITRVNG